MELNLMNPHVRYARRSGMWVNKTVFSRCYDCRLFYIEKGSGSVIADGEKYSISNNSAIFFPSGTRYRFRFDRLQEEKYYVLNFDLTQEYSYITEALHTPDEFDYIPENEKKTVTGFGEFENIIVKSDVLLTKELSYVVEQFITRGDYYLCKSSAMLKKCLFELLCESNRPSSPSDIVSKVKECIRENYSDSSLNNNSIASILGYHPYYLGRVFKEASGMSIHGYLTDFRLNIAKNYLTATDMDVDFVAWKAGFSSSSHFIQLFRTRMGTTPLKYRRQFI